MLLRLGYPPNRTAKGLDKTGEKWRRKKREGPNAWKAASQEALCLLVGTYAKTELGAPFLFI